MTVRLWRCWAWALLGVQTQKPIWLQTVFVLLL
jgi:hypothetical protein